MDQVEVDRVDAEVQQRLLARGADVLRSVVVLPDLGGEEGRAARARQALADLRLVVVRLGGVDGEVLDRPRPAR